MNLTRPLFTLAFAVSVTALALLSPSLGAQSAPTHVKGQILVQFKEGVGVPQASATARQHSAKLGAMIPGTKSHIVSVPAGKEAQLIQNLSRNPNVDFAELDVVASASVDYYERQYALNNVGQMFTNTAGDIAIGPGLADADIDAPEAWAVTTRTPAPVVTAHASGASISASASPWTNCYIACSVREHLTNVI